MATCKSCGAPIIWVKTKSGKKMPLDRDPVAGGNIVIWNDTAVVVKPDQDTKRYVSHFVTCAHAAQHRKR